MSTENPNENRSDRPNERNHERDEIIRKSEERGFEELEEQSHELKGKRAGTRMAPDFSANEDETTPSEDIEAYRNQSSNQEENKHGSRAT